MSAAATAPVATVTRPDRSEDRPDRSVSTTVVRVTGAARSRIDVDIVDRAAGLFARHGFEQTSVQAVADAVGLSKAGLLHHFPTKDALRRAVREHAEARGDDVVTRVAHISPGPERDHRTIEALVDVAAAHPGLVSFLLAPLSSGDDRPEQPDCAGAEDQAGVVSRVFEAFGLSVEPDPLEDDAVFERRIRVGGALASLAILSLSLSAADRPGAFRTHVISTSYDALGHPRPGAPASPEPPPAPSRPVQVEA